jgi:hypothetical protein
MNPTTKIGFDDPEKLVSRLVERILTVEPLEETLAEAFSQLGKLFRFDFISDDKTICCFTLSHCNERGEILPYIETILKFYCIKGSFNTFLWNPFARMDDEYFVQTEEVYSTPAPNIFSTLSSNTTASSSNKLNLFQAKDKTLWFVKGMDAMNKKISFGFVNWHEMNTLKSACQLHSIGLLAFSKILGRLILSLPLFALTSRYLNPMPLSFMYNYLVNVETVPFLLQVSPRFMPFIEVSRFFKIFFKLHFTSFDICFSFQ